jgi:hypothetical protein
MGPESADAFDDREAAEHHERNPQSPLARIFTPVMMVVMVVAVASAALNVAVIAATVVVSWGLRASRSGWVICLSHRSSPWTGTTLPARAIARSSMGGVTRRTFGSIC